MSKATKALKEIKSQKPGFIDRVAMKYFPGWAASREKARFERELETTKRAALTAANSWQGSSKSRKGLKSWDTYTASPDTQNNNELPTIRDRCLDLSRNVPIAAGALNNVKIYVVGDTGPTLKASLDGEFLGLSDEEVRLREMLIQREFSIYFNNEEFDCERSLPGPDFLTQVVMAWFSTGDVFTVRTKKERPGSPYLTKWQNIEAPLCSNPDNVTDGTKPDAKKYPGVIGAVYAGIERDPQSNEPLAYYIQNRYNLDNKLNTTTKWERVPAYDASGRKNVIHVHIKDRPRQSRGVPYLAPIIEPLKQLGRYTDGELMAAVVSGMFTVFVKSPDGRGISPIAGADTSNSDEEVEVGYGNVVGLRDDEDIETASPGRPNENFDPFVSSIIKQIGMALGQPHEVLEKAFQSSYSAARAAMLEAWRYFKPIRGILDRNWLRHVYAAFFEEAVALGRIPAPGFLSGDYIDRLVWLDCSWVWPAEGMIRPEVEIKAFAQADEHGYQTKEEITAALTGKNYDRNASQRKKEAGMEREIEEERTPAEGTSSDE